MFRTDHVAADALKASKTAIVTGVSGGIGIILTSMLLAEGYRVIGLSRSRPDITHEAFTHIAFDAAEASSLEQGCEALMALSPPFSLLIHCAAIITPTRVEAMKSDDILRQISVNLTMPVVLTSRLLAGMEKGGRIIFVNSMAAVMPLAGSSVYAATKAGLRNFALSLSQETASSGITVSSIFPGAVLTGMLRQEMAAGGSVLNFVSCPAEPEAVATAIMKLVQRPKSERFLPAVDGIFGGLCMLVPGLLRISMPVLTYFGRRGYKNAIRKKLF